MTVFQQNNGAKIIKISECYIIKKLPRQNISDTIAYVMHCTIFITKSPYNNSCIFTTQKMHRHDKKALFC